VAGHLGGRLTYFLWASSKPQLTAESTEWKATQLRTVNERQEAAVIDSTSSQTLYFA